MRLLAVPDASGTPTIWINADHLVSVQPGYMVGERGVQAYAEMKVDGMPLQRIPLGEHNDRTEAEAAFLRFLSALEGDS